MQMQKILTYPELLVEQMLVMWLSSQKTPKMTVKYTDHAIKEEKNSRVSCCLIMKPLITYDFQFK
jgi:hypothetical protein